MYLYYQIIHLNEKQLLNHVSTPKWFLKIKHGAFFIAFTCSACVYQNIACALEEVPPSSLQWLTLEIQQEKWQFGKRSKEPKLYM